MSTRERWVVYPLLFLAIVLGMRSGLILKDLSHQLSTEGRAQRIAAETIQAKALDAKAAKFDQLICGTIHCNLVSVMGPNDKPVVIIGADSVTKSGQIETRTASGVE